MDVQQCLSSIRSLAPEEYAADWDNSRVQVLGTRSAITRLAVTLDPVPGILAQALAWGADLVLTHHPLYFTAPTPTKDGQYLAVLRQFLGAGAWLYSAHTSLDCRPDGPAQWLGRSLGLTNCRILERVRSLPAREVFFQAPSRITEAQARPLAEAPGVLAVSQAASGDMRVACEERAWPEVQELLLAAFGRLPDCFVRRLEEPALNVGYGQVGDLPEALPLEGFARLLEQALFSVQQPAVISGAGGRNGPRGVAWAECGRRPETVKRVAYTTGSGASLIPAAFGLGADVFICGDVKHHAAQEAPGLVLDVGHFLLEEEMLRLFAQELDAALTGVEVRFFEGINPFGYRVLA